MTTESVPSIGRAVHFVLNNEFNYPGQHRSATIVQVWSGDYVNLHVQIDGGNDDPHFDYANPQLIKWITSVEYDPTGTKQRSWHWPEYVAPREV